MDFNNLDNWARVAAIISAICATLIVLKTYGFW